MKPRAVHQFHPGSAYGDGITNGMLFIRSILREAGYHSEIFCAHVDPLLAEHIQPMEAYVDAPDHLLLVHYSLGTEHHRWIEGHQAPRVLVYHNITPPEFLPKGSIVQHYAVLGRDKLAQWARTPLFRGAIADSAFNADELQALGYNSVETIPLLVDLDRIRAHAWNSDLPSSLRGARNLLFVGRICEHKGQLDLVRMMERLTAMCDEPVRLLLAGGTSSEAYLDVIRAEVQQRHLSDRVVLLGKQNDEDIFALYRSADAYVSLSQHEGFGMPLVEAMAFDLPVVAYSAGAIPATLKQGGLILESRDPDDVAAAVKVLLEEPWLRSHVIAKQRQALAQYEKPLLVRALESFLQQLGFDVTLNASATASSAPSAPRWQVEGPFDSSYSLAIVNRELSRGLVREGVSVSLVSRDGPGEFPPNREFLAQNPDVRSLWRARNIGIAPEVSLRNQYPPHVSDMKGVLRGLANYAWEESGFPAEYVQEFNTSLNLITVTSRFVAKLLRDNGVKTPIRVVGNGIDHILKEEVPQVPAKDEPTNTSAARRFIARFRRNLGMSVRGSAEGSDIDSNWPPKDHATSPVVGGVSLGNGFRFLHISSGFPRKGADALLQAWARAFSAADDVVLIIKAFPNEHNRLEEQIAALGQSHPHHAPIILINRDIDDAAVRMLYAAAEVIVAPSRGEGFGLPLAEALALGKPVITTAYGGHTDFCTPESAWLCDYTFAYAQTHLAVPGSVWIEPDVDSLASCLREAYQASPEERALRAKAGRDLVLSRYRWQDVARRTRQAVEDVRSLSSEALRLPRVAWISTWNSRCGIAAYSESLVSAIAPERLFVFANRNAELIGSDPSFVRRCWNQGWDDSLDELYDEICAKGVEIAVIQFNFGFFKLAAFSRLIERLSENGIAVYTFLHSTADVNKPDVTIRLGDAREALARARRILVHSVHDLNRLKSLGLTENVTLFPMGLPAPFRGDRADMRQRLGLEGRNVVASFGFLLPHKGLRELIQAASLLRNEIGDVHLLMLNALYPAPDSEQELQACRQALAAHEMEAHTTLLTDYMSEADILAHLAAADVIVFPYQHTQESASAAIKMGVASLTPVACTPLPIFADVSRIAYELPGTTPVEMAVGLRALFRDPKQLANLAERQRSWASAHEWSRVSRRLDGLLRGEFIDTFMLQDNSSKKFELVPCG